MLEEACIIKIYWFELKSIDENHGWHSEFTSINHSQLKLLVHYANYVKISIYY